MPPAPAGLLCRWMRNIQVPTMSNKELSKWYTVKTNDLYSPLPWEIQMNLGAYQSWGSQTLPFHKAPALVFFCEHRTSQDFGSNKEQSGAALSIKRRTYPMDVTHIALLSPISESRLHNTVKALVASPLSRQMLSTSTLHPSVYVISDGHELQRQSQTGAMWQVFSQLAGVGQRAHVLSTVVLSKPSGRSNMHRAQKTLEGKAVCGEEEREGQVKRSCLSFLPITFLFFSKLPPAEQVYKPFWLCHQACGWQL